jgi:DNA-binding NarL/FixJ family response regulator
MDVALPGIRRALDETGDAIARARLLPAAVEIELRAGETVAARAAADELARIADDLGTPYLAALAADASGAVLLAEDAPQEALPSLRAAHRLWRELDAPHHAARARVLVGIACRELGDAAGAELELEGAREALEALGARPEVDRLARITGTAAARAPLSGRETEVLGLVATGMSNRAIAAKLVISEKTVARHLSNIFAKLGVSSRTEAAAYAFTHDLLR